MYKKVKFDLPVGYQLVVSGLSLDIVKSGSNHRPFRSAEGEGALPARIALITAGRGENHKEMLLREKDFSADKPDLKEDGKGLSATGCHRGLRLSQVVYWEEAIVDGRNFLLFSRQVVLSIDSIEFTEPDYVRLLALTRWGNLVKGQSYELSTHMSENFYWEGGKQRGYEAWVTPCMENADGPCTATKPYSPSDVHRMGIAEYTVLSWPRKRQAVMVAEDPVEYLERNINPDSALEYYLRHSGPNSAQRGPAQVSHLAWLHAADRGTVYKTPWQHYYFLEEEDNPLVTSAVIWRERYARRLNQHLQPLDELQPWFATENLHGPQLSERWDGNLTALKKHYAALRRDPLDSHIHPILVHERPGFCAICTNMNQYFRSVDTSAGTVHLNVPLYHQPGDRFTLSCEIRPYSGEHDIGFQVRVSGSCFRFEEASLSPFKWKSRSDVHIPPQHINVRQSDDYIQVVIKHSADALASDLRQLEDHLPLFEIHLRVMREIEPDEGAVDAHFLYRKSGKPPSRHIKLVDTQQHVQRSGYTFSSDNNPLRVKGGLLSTSYIVRIEKYGYDSDNSNIFFEVKDGKPVRFLGGEKLARRLGKLMKQYDVALTVYVAAYGMRNYDFSRNANYLIPNVLALDENGESRPRWYKTKHRADELCPSCKEHNRMLDECLKKLLSWGPYGIYYDELCQGYGSCFGKEHGHGLSQHMRLAHRRGERIRRIAREAGHAEMYFGTEGGNLLQHTFAQGHNFGGIDPSRKDNNMEDIKRIVLAQVAYNFPDSRAYFNYVFRTPDHIFGHVLGLAFPRFALAPFTGTRHQVSYYFAAMVKKTFPDHYLRGHTEFPLDVLRPGSPPMTSIALVLRSHEGTSVHLANISGEELIMEKEGYVTQLANGCALMVDSFGNVMGETDMVQWQGTNYLHLDRPAAFGIWRNEEGNLYIQALEADRKSLRAPLHIFLSKELLQRMRVTMGEAHRWEGLDAEGGSIPIITKSTEKGHDVVYPSHETCRCLVLGSSMNQPNRQKMKR